MGEEAPAAPILQIPANLPIPAKLDIESNIENNWRKFKRAWSHYEIATGLAGKDTKLRAATFLTCIGPDGMDIFDGFTFAEPAHSQDIDRVMEKFETFCIGKCNEAYERYIFNTHQQAEDVTIDTYAAKLRKLAKTCNYGTLEDDLIRDRIVCGIRDNNLKKRLLQEDKLTLQKAIDMCRAFETTQARVKQMTSNAISSESSSDIHAVKYKQHRQQRQPKQHRQP